MTVFGSFSDFPPQVIGLNNPFVVDGDFTGRNHIPVTLTPFVSRPFVTVSPSPIVLNDANDFQALITITPSSIPTNWSDSGVVIFWSVSPNPNYTEPPNITLNLVPNQIEMCIEDSNCFAPGPTAAVPTLLIGYPSRPITVRSKVPPPADLQITLSANGTTLKGDPTPQPVLVFSQNPLVLTASQPWATFTMASQVFPNSGFVVMNILGQGGSVFNPLPALPANSVSFTFATTQIPSRIPDFNGSTPLTLTVGVPMQIAIHLEYPLPSNNATILAFSQGDALSIGGPANFVAGSTIAFINVTAQKYVADPLNIFFQTVPSDVTGPILPPANLTIVTAKRDVVTNSPANTAADPLRVFLGEPFPLSFELPFKTPNFVEFSVSGPVGNNNTAVFSFDKNIVHLDNSNTNAVIFVTPTVWASATETISETGDSFNAVLVLSLLRTANSDWAMYNEPGDLEFVVSRRPFFVAPFQTDNNSSSIKLRYGQTSRPILVSAPWAPTLQNLVGNVVLTPYSNLERGYAIFSPPSLTWNRASGQSQNITVTVLQQSDKVNIPTAFSVSWILSGSATDIQWFARTITVANFPTFTVGEPAFHFWTPGSLGGRTAGGALSGPITLLTGETVTVLVAPEEFPPTGVTLTIFCPDTLVTVPGGTPINANTASISFGPTGPLNAQFQLTAMSANPVTRSIDFELSGADASFYSEPAAIGVTVNPRLVTLGPIATAATLSNQTDRAYFFLQDLPQNDLSVTLVPTSPAAAAAFSFTPASVSFGPATPYSRSFVARALALGTYTYNIQLAGTDAAWYTPSQSQITFTCNLRDSPAISMTSIPNLIPGLLQGPYTITLNDAPDQDLTVTPRAGDWAFTPATGVVFAAGQQQAVFYATYTPEFTNTHGEDAKTEIFFTLSGSDAWKYVVPGSLVFLSSGNDVPKRALHFEFATDEAKEFVVGVPTAVRAYLDGPATADITFGMKSAGFTLPDSITIPAGQLSAWFTVTATAAPTQWFEQEEGLGANAVRVYFTVLNGAAPLFDVPPAQDWNVVLRTFLYDIMQTDGEFFNLQNTRAGFTAGNQVLVVGKASSVFSVTAQVAPTTSVTLTPTNPFLSFSPSSLTFSAGVLTVPFTVTATSVPPRGRPQEVDWILSGPDATAYSTHGLPDGTNLFIVPQLNFTFPTAIYIDGQADVTVNVIGGVPAEGFTLHISAGTTFGVAIEPSALNFGGSGAPAPAPATPAPANGTNVTAAPITAAPQPAGAGRKFTIRHLRPSVVSFPNYPLTYTIKYGGFGSNDITLPVGTVPLYASVVTVLRYGIVPDFPFTLGYRNSRRRSTSLALRSRPCSSPPRALSSLSRTSTPTAIAPTATRTPLVASSSPLRSSCTLLARTSPTSSCALTAASTTTRSTTVSTTKSTVSPTTPRLTCPSSAPGTSALRRRRALCWPSRLLSLSPLRSSCKRLRRLTARSGEARHFSCQEDARSPILHIEDSSIC